MIIKALDINNFGKFSGESMSFSNGINVIYGQNEAGKTTLYHAVDALLFGLEKQRGRGAKTDVYSTYQPWENKTWFEGSLKFEVGEKVFVLERNFYHPEKSVRLYCETDGEELSVEAGDLQMLLGGANASMYANTAAVGQQKMKPHNRIFDDLENYIAAVAENGNHGTDVIGALSILEKRKKELEQKKKRQLAEIQKKMERLDAGMELQEKELKELGEQLSKVKQEKEQLTEVERKTDSIWAAFLWVLKKIFCRRRLQKRNSAKERPDAEIG